MKHRPRRSPAMMPIVLALLSLLWGCGQDPDARSTQTSAALDTTQSIPVVMIKPPKPIEEMNRAERQAYIRTLSDSGAYRCCVDPACTSCLFEEDPRCRCADAVRSKDPVCGDCYRGWKRGDGSVAGIKASDVRRR